jgi:hypothetical protein
MSIEDKLHATMNEHGAHWMPPAGRMEQLRRAIARRRRARIAACAGVVALAAGAGSLTLAAIPPPKGPILDTAGPAVKPSLPLTTAKSSLSPANVVLPSHAAGEHLVASRAGSIAPGRSSFTMTYTPTRWDFSIGFACQTGAPQQMEVIIDHGMLPYMVTDCNTTADFRGLPDEPPHTDSSSKGWWQSQGRHIRLNHAMTITVNVGGKRLVGNVMRSGDATATGSAAVGVYLPD